MVIHRDPSWVPRYFLYTTLKTVKEDLISTQFFNSNPNLDILIIDMNNDRITFSVWSNKNRLSINETKTEYILINSNSHTNLYPVGLPPLKLNNVVLEQVASYEYLRVSVHERFSFLPHINKIIAKAQNKIYMLTKIRKLRYGNLSLQKLPC